MGALVCASSIHESRVAPVDGIRFKVGDVSEGGAGIRSRRQIVPGELL